MNRANTPFEKSNALDAWLAAVSTHLAVRKTESRSSPSVRNRSRQRARMEARRLFAEYERDLALARELFDAPRRQTMAA